VFGLQGMNDLNISTSPADRRVW